MGERFLSKPQLRVMDVPWPGRRGGGYRGGMDVPWLGRRMVDVPWFRHRGDGCAVVGAQGGWMYHGWDAEGMDVPWFGHRRGGCAMVGAMDVP